ncbi:hypothetical protein JCM8547_001203 [Rhodosporidiobolus lusitaniae]
MDLPAPPRAAKLPSAVLPPVAVSSPPLSSPINSPYGSRPPSPVGQRVSYAYPATPSIGGEQSIAPSSLPASRSGSRSKLLRERPRPAQRSFFSRLFRLQKQAAGESIELDERGRTAGRRLSVGQVEAALERQRTAGGASSIASSGGGKKEATPWYKDSKTLVGFAMIALVGMNDSATGANLDRMQETYNVSADEISLVFLANAAGYAISSFSASSVLHHFGLQVALGVACFGMCGGCLTLSFAPPFGVFVASLAFLGFGSGMYDTCITTVVSHEEDGILMSLTYAFFGIGAMISPLVIGAFVDKGFPWRFYYYMPLGISLILAVIGYFVFSGYEAPPDETHDTPLATAQVPEVAVAAHDAQVIHGRAVMSAQQRMKRALRVRAVWVGFFLITLAFASSDILSAWIVSFMVQKRSFAAGASRYVLSGTWAGIGLGRIALAPLLSKRLGEKTFAVVMLAAASGMLAVMYVRNFVVDAVAVVLVGFFFGPVTPKVISAVSGRVPPSLKGSVVSLTVGLGLVGSAVGPLLFGIVAGRGGLSSLPAVLIGASVCAAGGWLVMPKNRRRED